MKKRQNRVWQIMIILTLLFVLGVLICARADQTAGFRKPEIVRSEAADEDDDEAATSDWPVPQENNENAATAQESQELPEETELPKQVAELIVWDSTPKLLESVPLGKEIQREIFDLCGQDDSLFCAVMAISNKESRFTPAIIGDNGRCVGMMQINYAFHIDRMKALGVTNLLDPIENAAVAISYIKELEKEFFVGPDSHVLYVAYNMGPTGARELFDKGVYSTSYSWDVAAYYEAYMQELSAG